MSTIGHPLSDLCNLLQPYALGVSERARAVGRGNAAFLPNQTPGLPTKEECIGWYREVAGWDPTPDITWGEAFALYRLTIIMQGIAARYAARQASSARASEYAANMKPFGLVGWELVEKCMSEGRGGGKIKL